MEYEFDERGAVFVQQAFPGQVKGFGVIAEMKPSLLHLMLVGMLDIKFPRHRGGFGCNAFAALSIRLHSFIVAITKSLFGHLRGKHLFQIVRCGNGR